MYSVIFLFVLHACFACKFLYFMYDHIINIGHITHLTLLDVNAAECYDLLLCSQYAILSKSNFLKFLDLQ